MKKNMHLWITSNLICRDRYLCQIQLIHTGRVAQVFVFLLFICALLFFNWRTHVMPNANHDKETEIWSKESPMDAVCRGESSELAAPGNMNARWAKEKIKKRQ